MWPRTYISIIDDCAFEPAMMSLSISYTNEVEFMGYLCDSHTIKKLIGVCYKDVHVTSHHNVSLPGNMLPKEDYTS